MLYNELDYAKEKDLVLKRIARTALKRKYPSKYVEEISIIVDQYFNLYQFAPNEVLLNHPKVQEAFSLAEKSHFGQVRKYTDEEYIVHLREVASFLSSIPENTYEEVVSGLLHDVVEKGNVSLDFIKDNFGYNVFTHVDYLSDKATLEDGNRKERMIKNWKHFSQCPPTTNNIKAIDILSNTRSTMLCDGKYGATYLEPIVEFMNPYFQQCEHLNPEVKSMFKKITELSQQIVLLQKKHNISKLEKAYANQVKNEKRKFQASITI